MAIGVALLVAGYFWVGGISLYVLYALSLIMLSTGILGYCPLYTLFGMAHVPVSAFKAKDMLFIVAGLGVLAGSASYASIFFTKKIFLEDYGRVNGYYKQALFATGQAQLEDSQTYFGDFEQEFGTFTEKYAAYRPYAISRDQQFTGDMNDIAQIVKETKPLIGADTLKPAHLALERVRPIFQDILRRNGFSLLAVSLVDFHDAMEEVLTAAQAKDAAGVATAYAHADERLKVVEQISNDADIQAIRAALEEVQKASAQGALDELPTKAADLKKNFVKVYLQRG
jgi:hypothetical protein